MTTASHPDCTVLVTSCDAYRDVERPFLALWRKFWPDCPFELVVNGETGSAEGFDRAILSGKGKCWSAMLAEALAQITTPYVLMLMNDYYLNAPVDTRLLLRRLAACKAQQALNYRLNPNPPRAIKNTAYAVSCQAGIWDREFLRSLALKTKSAWEFERYGSFMFDPSDPRPILVSEKQEFPFTDAVHKGCWEPAGVALLKANDIACDFSVRGLPSFKKRLVEGLKKLIFKLFPWTLIVRIQNLLNVGMKESSHVHPVSRTVAERRP